MHIHIISIGTKMPDWIDSGINEYIKRMPRECEVKIIELPAAQRSKSTDLTKAILDEGRRMLKAVPKNCDIIALDVKGKEHSTESLSVEMKNWLTQGNDIALLIGGADGLSQECLSSSKSKWSLSKLTYPHPLVRVILAEQLYRAWSLLNNHPYHRA
jgi:23S rRNA (pseudouridine1915-N3)-methyltransferase